MIFSSSHVVCIERKAGHGLDFPKSYLDPIQIPINGLDLKSIYTLTRSNIFGFFFKSI